jgi:hypothetical protein
MKKLKHIKLFENFKLNEELLILKADRGDTSDVFPDTSHLSDVSDSKFEMIGPDMDEIMDGINFINQNYDDSVKLKPMDWSQLVSDNYSIFVKFEPEGDENKHIKFMNDMLSENNFDCKLYKTK